MIATPITWAWCDIAVMRCASTREVTPASLRPILFYFISLLALILLMLISFHAFALCFLCIRIQCIFATFRRFTTYWAEFLIWPHFWYKFLQHASNHYFWLLDASSTAMRGLSKRIGLHTTFRSAFIPTLIFPRSNFLANGWFRQTGDSSLLSMAAASLLAWRYYVVANTSRL